MDANADADADADADEEGEAREGGDVGKEEYFIGRGGDDTVDAAGGRGRGGGGGLGARQGGQKRRPHMTRGDPRKGKGRANCRGRSAAE